MKYFNTLPKIIKIDSAGNSILLTNLLARASVISSLMTNPLVYYNYDLQDGDTPEIVAYKYYGDVYRYWIVLYANQVTDPQWQWPMSGVVFNNYMADKYPSINPNATVQQYQKIITTTDLITNTITVNTVQVDQNTYTTLIPSTKTFTLPSGRVTVAITKNALSVYDYEVQQNEANRNIKILKSTYVDEIEKEFTKLMSQ